MTVPFGTRALSWEEAIEPGSRIVMLAVIVVILWTLSGGSVDLPFSPSAAT